MADIHSITNPERDEERARLERAVRRMDAIADHADEVATYRFKMYCAYRRAGFGEWDALQMSRDGAPLLSCD